MYKMAQETVKFIIRQDGMVTEEVIGVVGNAKGLKGNVQINYFSKDLEKNTKLVLYKK